MDDSSSRWGNSQRYRKDFNRDHTRNQRRFGGYRSQNNYRDHSYKNHPKQLYSQSQNETEKQRELQTSQTVKGVSAESLDIGLGVAHVPAQKKQQEPIYQKSNQQSQNSQHLTTLTQDFLNEIQNLDFQNLKFQKLQQQFRQIVQGHINFKEIYPQSESDLGTSLIANGLFHEMWGKVLLKSGEKYSLSFWAYYQKYQNLLQKNHSNFQSMFNQYSYSSQIAYEQQEGTNSNTNLLASKKKYQMEKINTSDLKIIEQDRVREDNSEYESISHRTIQHLNFSSKQNIIPTQNREIEVRQEGRLRHFGIMQLNQRKLNVEIVCFFLNIHKVYKLELVHFSEILQIQLTAQTQMVLLKGQVEAYCQQLKRIAVNHIPKLLLIAYGEVNLTTLLRLKNTYGLIEGMVVYDEIIDIRKWLQRNGHITDENL